MKQMIPLMALAVVLGIGGGAARATGANVTVNPYGPPNTTNFPPDNPPGDLGPGESADAKSDVNIDATDGVTFNPVGSGTQVQITGITVTVSGHTEIRQPSNATDTLKGHELGHNDLFQFEYSTFAQQKVKAALDPLVGKTFDTQQAAEDAFNAALDKAKAAIQQQMQALSDKYDRLAAHGTSTTVTSAQGVQMVKDERNRAAAASTQPHAPSTTQPNAQGSGHASVTPTGDALQLTDPQGLTVPASFTDPLDTLGMLAIQPPIIIGPLDNGNTLLSDAHVQILNRFTNQPLLDGYLFGPELMTSTLPQFQFMIQGVVDIPPESAAGIVNSIGSPFLSQLQGASDNDAPVFLWYFTNADPTGPQGTDGLFVLGSLPPEAPAGDAGGGAVPEPLSLPLVALALLAMGSRALGRIRDE